MSEFIISVLEFFSDLGYIGIALGLMIEIIPSELVLGYGGYLVGSGKIVFFGALAAGVTGGTLAQLFLYWAGYFGGRPFLLKYGKYIFIKERHLEIAEQWFDQYGVGVIFTARFIPVVRHAISIPAGIAKMSALKFTIFTIAAIIPWTILFLALGMVLGENWRNIKGYAAPYMIPVMVTAILCVIIYYIWKRRRTPPIVTVKKIGKY
ncbi:DedA family protein [Peribacillus cavernae]|uniref:DedA family protein n=1 Tax=Peribacillus cavernae TaxID=1674310 RepID=A0A3S0W269_9BACI|nr:DedA family protein [Peribacillus cavernae]MDQ0219938.1 membrane protein DedA with SNARE-associated domain [Peribacillus cavernae]RUQ24249.1 DedA family protein [Peribacillus cavernae]